MSDKERTPTIFGRIRECFAALKEIAIVVIIVLLFVNPNLIGRTLYQAGITSLFGIGLDMERLAEASANAAAAGESVNEVSRDLQQVNAQLARLAEAPTPNRRQLKELSATVQRLDTKASAAKRTIESSNAIQRQLMEHLPPHLQRGIKPKDEK